MHQLERYKEHSKMIDLVDENYRILLIMSRFGISLGFGDKNIGEVCRDNNVDTATFLAIANLLLDENKNVDYSESNLSVAALITYLHSSHEYFLDFRFPSIRKDLLEVLGNPNDKLAKAIIRYFDEYVDEVRKHMNYEEKNVFPYVRSLLNGETPKDYSIDTFRTQHDKVEARLYEFKNIFIKYYTTEGTNMINSVLFDIFNCEQDLASHNEIEDRLFVPTVTKLEEEIKEEDEKPEVTNSPEILSAREKEVLSLVVKGMTSKQIADKLIISTHTVITHRRNISAKLQIHSTAGLTIYAIVNKLVDLEEIKDIVVE